MQDIETAIVAFVGEMHDGDPAVDVTSDTRLLESGLLDSIGLVRLIQFIEETFGVAIPDADVTPDTFASPSDLATYVGARRT